MEPEKRIWIEKWELISYMGKVCIFKTSCICVLYIHLLIKAIMALLYTSIPHFQKIHRVPQKFFSIWIFSSKFIDIFVPKFCDIKILHFYSFVDRWDCPTATSSCLITLNSAVVQWEVWNFEPSLFFPSLKSFV